ncbi:hypothetical protein [Stackebrandtia soli]|uniref:hypothetical protein n=1 Tax=Stackebrandtia soli TaxID=1892856 RepID=UPI0039ED4C25
MSDYLVSLIRTWVPVAVGSVAAWLTAHGVDLNTATTTALTTGGTAVAAAVYYAAARALERRWPAAGYLLGTKRPPTYTPPAPKTDT